MAVGDHHRDIHGVTVRHKPKCMPENATRSERPIESQNADPRSPSAEYYGNFDTTLLFSQKDTPQAAAVPV